MKLLFGLLVLLPASPIMLSSPLRIKDILPLSSSICGKGIGGGIGARIVGLCCHVLSK